jgi:hypothetical protein
VWERGSAMFDNRRGVLCAHHKLIVTLHEPANIHIQLEEHQFHLLDVLNDFNTL